MKEQYQNLFDSLNATDTGKVFVEYLRELQSEVCDVRNIKDADVKSALYASGIIQEKIIDKILLRSQKTQNPANEYE